MEPPSGQGRGMLLAHQLGKVSVEVFSSLRNCDGFYLGQINWAQVVGVLSWQLLTHTGCTPNHDRHAVCFKGGGGHSVILGNSCVCFASRFCGHCYKYFVHAKIWKSEDRSQSFRRRISCHYSAVGLWQEFHRILFAAVTGSTFFTHFYPEVMISG